MMTSMVHYFLIPLNCPEFAKGKSFEVSLTILLWLLPFSVGADGPPPQAEGKTHVDPP